MRTFFTAALIAAMMAPVSAGAQTRELHRDRQDIRQEQRELRDAWRRGDRRDIREERRDLREARQEYREDRRDYRRDVRDDWRRDRRDDWRDDRRRNWGRDDWRGYRNDHRAVYARGNWRAPFRYQSFRAGARIAPAYYGGRYAIVSPARYRLPPAYGATRWVRHYDDVLLVDARRGVVLDVIRNFFW